jgi:ribosomal protein S18 acetylase RimI-like enzyme
VRVRAAVASDAAALVRLDQQTWTPDVTPAVDLTPTPGPIEDVLVAESGGVVCGYVQLGPATSLPSNAHVMEIKGLAVDPERRQGGIGRALVEAACAEAASRGAVRVRLHVLGPNAAARALYAECGFVVDSVWRDEFRLGGRAVDDVLMVRELAGGVGETVAVVITGAPGVGKSSVLEALAGRLGDEGVVHAAFESEQLAWGEPWLSLEETLPMLATYCRHARDAGRGLLLISATTETASELELVLRAVGAARHLVVCLAASGDCVAARVAAREPDWWSGKDALVAHARVLAGVIPSLPGVDVVVPTEDAAPVDVAARVRDELASRGLA